MRQTYTQLKDDFRSTMPLNEKDSFSEAFDGINGSFSDDINYINRLLLTYKSPYCISLQRFLLSTNRTQNHGRSNLHVLRKNGFIRSYSENGRQFFSNRYVGKKATFQFLSHLNDLTLNNIPREPLQGSSSELTIFSLFQGFNNKIKIINEMIHYSKDLEKNNEEQDGQFFSFDIDPSIIRSSFSVGILNNISSSITNKLGSLDIEKSSLQYELSELEKKVEQLNIKQELLYQKLESINKNESFLKGVLEMSTSRKDLVREYGLEKTKNSSSGENDILDKYLKNEKKIVDSYELSSESKSKFMLGTLSTFSDDSSYRLESTSDDLLSNMSLDRFYSGPHKKIKRYLGFAFEDSFNNQTGYVQKAHEDNITTLDFDFPNGTLSTAGHLDHTIKLWDLTKSTQIGELKGHKATVNSLQMDLTYNMVISAGKDATVKLWNVDLGIESFNTERYFNPCIYTFDSHTDEITAISSYHENLVSGSRDKTIRQWDLKTGKCIQILNIGFLNSQKELLGTVDPIRSPPPIGALQCRDAALATGGQDGIVRLWDLRIGKVVRSLSGHENAITALKFDDLHVVTGSLDKTAITWDLRTGHTVNRLEFDNPISSIDVDIDKITIATGQNSVRIVDRYEDKSWTCGETANPLSKATIVRYKDGQMIDGRSNGDVNIWHI
ncbi:hypothetical protein KAFR_0A03380 [Kazachstania africana CBS 2517]|uniref:Uncharacterized protein n=1 Tax=Kazachstania africana (strain ATCC 22294 / BCRC 22015 / CBS 2517 / CECT 1963 / NBRC 1671 / NRRL Y-8276) TaxID=1071382 RepID=H2AN23_KAZAF|nr:hypothetical protein KAFR_0A03380 [Kazachstania africana CBS 2517]CCF55773.1 hypothetical protein KAFR_0A03380 [Kazachstania africana CBS 2517]